MWRERERESAKRERTKEQERQCETQRDRQAQTHDAGKRIKKTFQGLIKVVEDLMILIRFHRHPKRPTSKLRY